MVRPRTVGVAVGLRGLPVHGSLDGFLPSGEAELALCGGQTEGVRPGGTISASAPTGSPPGSVLLTVRVDLRLEFLGGDVWEVAGAQAPHVHPLCRPRCHGRTQSRGLRHGGSHWTNRRQTKETVRHQLGGSMVQTNRLCCDRSFCYWQVTLVH